MSKVNLDHDSLEFCLNGIGMQEDDVEEMAKYLDVQVPYKGGNSYKSLGFSKGLPPPLEEQPPKLEFKSLPKHLKYAFLGENETLPVMLNWMWSNLKSFLEF